MSQSDHAFMRTALSLARRGLGRVWPNPAVGCVIVKAGRVIGRGWTQPGGRPHAETMALAQAGARARGAVAYVTLEPCAHHGQTPPCAEALIGAGITRVVAALEDSDPRVSGRGFAQLRAAGIAVQTGLCASEAAEDNAGFFLRTELGRPQLTLKLALTLDGRIATRTGDSQWITGFEARRAVHGFRANHDAVLIGAGTARADDPALTARGLGVSHQPVRIVAAQGLSLPLDGKLARSARDIPLWLCHGQSASEERRAACAAVGATLISCESGEAGIGPRAMLTALGSKGLTRVFCEGGGHLAASLLRADLVDRLIVHSAGVAIGADGLGAIAPMGRDVLGDAPRLRLVSHRRLGADIEHVWQRA
ncbi:bifunctional diaminohydroxyphosphoribosylaminopyrimidine deaminase/5-amino-6-(5-phosphoribosylamino)uracil reductase RibD [Planktotalea arctica]|uniref:bifunctional diaminohydroxyphosphoribosylaminopyrimidine deaminase/5-amino-6-(5-phosphoribosylamino)uracil reductase RibD n=1 Tax=Planktotalea arctica TaxID=1481893 RepID=UPI002481FA6A|nr:bifunctional diaminohydroxyphosphoribosylaminopyrimidine deaminase/5-amino-6-(5-phosphoribosylamino)uracil reductase RibD [Planktotalea arctica]